MAEGLGSTDRVVTTEGSAVLNGCASESELEVARESVEVVGTSDDVAAEEPVELAADASDVVVSAVASDVVVSADAVVEEVDSAAEDDVTAEAVSDAEVDETGDSPVTEELVLPLLEAGGAEEVVHVVITSTRGSPFAPMTGLKVITHSSVTAVPSLRAKI